jgi:hypothetical protein
MPVPPLVVQALTLLVALCVIMAFGALFGWAMGVSWRHRQEPGLHQPGPLPGDRRVHIPGVLT